MSQKTIDRILELVETLTPCESARLAAQILEFCGVSRETCDAFAEELSESNKEELACGLYRDAL